MYFGGARLSRMLLATCLCGIDGICAECSTRVLCETSDDDTSLVARYNPNPEVIRTYPCHTSICGRPHTHIHSEQRENSTGTRLRGGKPCNVRSPHWSRSRKLATVPSRPVTTVSTVVAQTTSHQQRRASSERLELVQQMYQDSIPDVRYKTNSICCSASRRPYALIPLRLFRVRSYSRANRAVCSLTTRLQSVIVLLIGAVKWVE